MHCLAAKKLGILPQGLMARIEKVSELTLSVVEGILKHSVSDVSLRILDVSDPEGLGDLKLEI